MKTLLISPGYDKYFAVTTPEMFAQLISAPIYKGHYVSGEGDKYTEERETKEMRVIVLSPNDIITEPETDKE